MTNKFVNGKILIGEGSSFTKVQDLLYQMGYRWVKPGKLRLKNIKGKVNSIFFYPDGQMKYSGIQDHDREWTDRTAIEYKVVDGELKAFKEWERGDPGPAPIYYVFEDTPPNEEEAPSGYMTSACGTEFQRVEAAMFFLGVRIVLKPDTTKLEVQITKLKEKKQNAKSTGTTES